MSFFGKIIPLFLCLLIVLTPFSVYALETDLVDDEVNWIDKGETVTYNSDYFQGFSKYIADSEEGCFYFFARFTDYRIDTEINENIALSVMVKNAARSFRFKVDKNGIVDGTNDDIEIHSNFSEASCLRQGGGVFVAFKLKNKTDRALNNSISCEYYCGDNLTYNMLDGVSLDMYVPQTQKSTSDKTSKAATQRATNVNNTKASAAETDNESSTKFSGTGKIINENTNKNEYSSKNSYSKFSGEGTIAEFDNGFTQNYESYNSSEKSDNGENNFSDSVNKTLSTQSKLLIAVFVILFSVGVICIIIGCVNNRNTEKDKAENSERDHNI